MEARTEIRLFGPQGIRLGLSDLLEPGTSRGKEVDRALAKKGHRSFWEGFRKDEERSGAKDFLYQGRKLVFETGSRLGA